MWKLGQILGIDVSVHWTLLLLIFVTALTGGGMFGALVLMSVFGCVLLHELGHSMAARQFGIETHSIVLLPIGGVASLEEMPRKPSQELWIAVAGPLVNVVIAFALAVSMSTLTVAFPGYTTFFQYMLAANVSLVLFNLLPAFPMDGGRVLRSLLAMKIPYGRATQIAAGTGKVVAVALGIAGILYGPIMLTLAAAFVYFAGSAEARMVAEDERLAPSSAWQEGFARRFEDARTFTASRAGVAAKVIWDENERRYRYATNA